MKVEKRNKYILKASIHTFNIGYFADLENETLNNFEKMNVITTARTRNDSEPCRGKVNLNKHHGDLFSFSEFKDLFMQLTEEMTSYKINRIDLRLDSYDMEHYKEFEKLNRYLVTLISVMTKAKNKYRVTDLYDISQISVVAKTRSLEIEHYNRALKSQVTGNTSEKAKSRLELRSIARDRDAWLLEDVKGLFDKWIDRLEDAICNIDELIEQINTLIANKYLYDNEFTSLYQFLNFYKCNLYSTKQVQDLLRKIGIDDKFINSIARHFKERFKPEYISKNDLQFAVREIKRAINEFFNN